MQARFITQLCIFLKSATRINHINQLNPFNYGNKKLLEIIHEHWEDLAPKLIGDVKIKETAKSMCGNTLMSVWLNSAKETKQQTKMNNPSVKRIAKSGKVPSQPTWGVLIEALKSIGLEDIGKHLENEINNKYKWSFIQHLVRWTLEIIKRLFKR